MHKSNTILVGSDPTKRIRLFVNNEIFIDQTLPFLQNKLTVNYDSNKHSDTFTLTDGTHTQNFEVSADQSVAIDFNK